MNNPAEALGAVGAPTGLISANTGQLVSVAVYLIASGLGAYLAYRNRSALTNITRAKEVAPGELIANDALTNAPPSFSRIAGVVGVAYLTAFCWALGFYILVKIWVDPAAVEKAIAGTGDFIMTGSALFAPYAFNQLSQIFGRKSVVQSPPQSSSGQSGTADPNPDEVERELNA